MLSGCLYTGRDGERDADNRVQHILEIKQQLQKFKSFWHNITGHFHKRICYDKNELFEKFDTRPKEVDTEYKNNLNIPNHLLMVVAWISELNN